MTNTSMTSTGNESFFQIWLSALTKPRESTYADLAASPRARANTAYLWVFLCSFAPALAGVLVSGGQVAQQLEQAGLDTGSAGGGIGATLISLLCGAPIGAVVAVVFFIIGVALMQWIGKMFGGTGRFDQMAYTLGAITAPSMLVSALLTLPSLVPYVGACTGALSGLFGLYLAFVQVTAIKGVHKFGWGAAIGTYLIPVVAVILVACCIGAVVASVMGLAMGDVFSTINQSLGQ